MYSSNKLSRHLTKSPSQTTSPLIFGRSTSTTQGALTGRYPTSITAALTNNVSSPSLSPFPPSSETSTKTALLSFAASKSTPTLSTLSTPSSQTFSFHSSTEHSLPATSATPSVHSNLSAPHPS